MVFLLDDALADIFICLSEELRTNLEIVGETRAQWVISFCQMSILCSTNGLSLLFAVFWWEKTIVLENPNGSFYKSLKLTYAYKLRAQFGCVK